MKKRKKKLREQLSYQIVDELVKAGAIVEYTENGETYCALRDEEEIARHTFQVIGHFVRPTFEQWEYDLCREPGIVYMWLTIANAFEVAVAEHPDLNEYAILIDLIGLSLGEPSQHGLEEAHLAAGGEYQGDAD
jgi:hypothetical protein